MEPKAYWGAMPSARKKLGAWGEKLARRYLEERGFSILETNFRCPLGEIDIIAQKGEEMVFVEVRTRRSLSFGSPEESLTPAKRERLINLAYTYLQTQEALPPSWRIDLLVVELTPKGKVSRIELLENAVTPPIYP